MLNQEEHSYDDLKRLLCDELRLRSWFNAYNALRDDAKFNELPLREQLYRIGLLCKVNRLESSYKALKSKSNTPKSIVLPTVVELAKSNDITVSKMDFVVNKMLKNNFSFVAITGGCGIGKTTLGNLLIDQVLKRGKSAFYNDYNMQIKSLCYYYEKRDTYLNMLKELVSNKVVMLDDAFLNLPSQYEVYCLKDIIDNMIEKKHVLILASQHEVKEWYSWLKNDNQDNSLLVDAIIDRLTANPIVFEMNGESRRKATQKGVKISMNAVQDSNVNEEDLGK